MKLTTYTPFSISLLGWTTCFGDEVPIATITARRKLAKMYSFIDILFKYVHMINGLNIMWLSSVYLLEVEDGYKFEGELLVHVNHHSLLPLLHRPRVQSHEFFIEVPLDKRIADENWGRLHLCWPIYLSIELNVENLQLGPCVLLEGLLQISSAAAQEEGNVSFLYFFGFWHAERFHKPPELPLLLYSRFLPLNLAHMPSHPRRLMKTIIIKKTFNQIIKLLGIVCLLNNQIFDKIDELFLSFHENNL